MWGGGERGGKCYSGQQGLKEALLHLQVFFHRQRLSWEEVRIGWPDYISIVRLPDMPCYMYIHSSTNS